MHLRRADRGVHDCLGPRAIVETRRAWPAAADGIHKLPCLIIAERDQRIAGSRVTGRARPGPEFFWNHDGFHPRPTSFTGLQLVPLSGNEDITPFAAIHLHVIETAPA